MKLQRLAPFEEFYKHIKQYTNAFSQSSLKASVNIGNYQIGTVFLFNHLQTVKKAAVINY